MPFDQATFATIGAQSSDTPNIYSYQSSDSLTLVTSVGYFYDKRFQLAHGDIIFAVLGGVNYDLSVAEDGQTARLKGVNDFFVEVAKGAVPGHSTRGLVLRNPSVNNALEDIWGGAGDLVYPAAAESWEVASLSPNDTAAGTGAQQVLVNYLDDEYNQQSIIVELNGTTAVPLNADHFRPGGVTVIRSGSSKVNEGKITVRVAGGGAERNIIDVGFSASQDCHFTVPAGKTAYALVVTPFYPKNEDGAITGKVIPFGSNTDITTGLFPFYQDTFGVVFKALFPLGEKTDVRFQAKSTNIGVEVNMVFEILLVDN